MTCEFKLPLEPEGMRFKLEKNEELISEIPTLQYVYEDENVRALIFAKLLLNFF